MEEAPEHIVHTSFRCTDERSLAEVPRKARDKDVMSIMKTRCRVVGDVKKESGEAADL